MVTTKLRNRLIDDSDVESEGRSSIGESTRTTPANSRPSRNLRNSTPTPSTTLSFRPSTIKRMSRIKSPEEHSIYCDRFLDGLKKLVVLLKSKKQLKQIRNFDREHSKLSNHLFTSYHNLASKLSENFLEKEIFS